MWRRRLLLVGFALLRRSGRGIAFITLIFRSRRHDRAVRTLSKKGREVYPLCPNYAEERPK